MQMRDVVPTHRTQDPRIYLYIYFLNAGWNEQGRKSELWNELGAAEKKEFFFSFFLLFDKSRAEQSREVRKR